MQQIESLESIAPAPSDDDKEIFALFFEWLAIVEESERLSREYREEGIEHDDDDFGRLHDQRCAIEDRILTLEPQTFRGLWCFLRIAWFYRRDDYPADWTEDAPRKLDDFDIADAFLLTSLYHATRLLLDRGRP